MVDINKNIEDCNPNKKRKILIVFDDMIVDMRNYKKVNPIVSELFIRGRKLNISLAFIAQSYFSMPKDTILICTHYFVIKFQINKNLNKLHPKIYQILTFKTLLIFNLYKKKYCKTIFFFWLLIILFFQIILHILERIL